MAPVIDPPLPGHAGTGHQAQPPLPELELVVVSDIEHREGRDGTDQVERPLLADEAELQGRHIERGADRIVVPAARAGFRRAEVQVEPGELPRRIRADRPMEVVPGEGPLPPARPASPPPSSPPASSGSALMVTAVVGMPGSNFSSGSYVTFTSFSAPSPRRSSWKSASPPRPGTTAPCPAWARWTSVGRGRVVRPGHRGSRSP